MGWGGPYGEQQGAGGGLEDEEAEEAGEAGEAGEGCGETRSQGPPV